MMGNNGSDEKSDEFMVDIASAVSETQANNTHKSRTMNTSSVNLNELSSFAPLECPTVMIKKTRNSSELPSNCHKISLLEVLRFDGRSQVVIRNTETGLRQEEEKNFAGGNDTIIEDLHEMQSLTETIDTPKAEVDPNVKV